MNFVHASLSFRNDSESSFSHRGCPVELFYIRLSLRSDLEISFYYCEGPVKVMHACLSVDIAKLVHGCLNFRMH